jgi:hypothetical protein
MVTDFFLFQAISPMAIVRMMTRPTGKSIKSKNEEVFV